MPQNLFGNFFLKRRKFILLRKFSRSLHKKLYLDLGKWSQNQNFFLEISDTFLLREVSELFYWNKWYFLAKRGFLVIRNFFLFWHMLLNSSQILSQKGQERFLSETNCLALGEIFLHFLDLRTYFSNQENVSQWGLGFCSACIFFM